MGNITLRGWLVSLSVIGLALSYYAWFWKSIPNFVASIDQCSNLLRKGLVAGFSDFPGPGHLNKVLPGSFFDILPVSTRLPFSVDMPSDM